MPSPIDDIKGAQEALLDYALYHYHVAPPGQFQDGSDVKSAEEYAAIERIPVVEAAARMGQKDVYSGAGGHAVASGVGTVVEGSKRPLKRRMRRLIGYRDCECEDGKTCEECRE